MFESLPRNHFHAIAADPGTRFDARSPKGIGARSPEMKYTTQTDAEIAAWPVGELARDHAFLFYWDTTPRITVGRHIPIMRAWGFEPCAFAFTWIKLLKSEAQQAPWFYPRGGIHRGLGFTTRNNSEVCILGRRGHPRRLRQTVFEVIFHSRRDPS